MRTPVHSRTPILRTMFAPGFFAKCLRHVIGREEARIPWPARRARVPLLALRAGGLLGKSLVALLLFAGHVPNAAQAQQDRSGPDPKLDAVELDGLRFQDPPLQLKQIIPVFPAGLKSLWLKALQRDEVDLQRQAADAVVRAHELGMDGLAEFEPLLVRLAEQPETHPLVHVSVARALVALDTRRAAPLLAGQSVRSGLSYAQVVEPALARWGYAPRLSEWGRQVGDTSLSIAERLLAARCLSAAADAASLPMLEQRVLDRRENATLRLEAARAVASLGSERVVSLAESLAKPAPPETTAASRSAGDLVERLLAVSLLQAADGEPGLRMLEGFTGDAEPAVAALAIQRLLDVAPQRVVERAEPLMGNRDARVRLLTARCLAARPSPQQVERLAVLLADPHPHVRRFARASLLDFGQKESLAERVRAEALKTLASDDWRALEQAALLVAELDHEPAAPQLVGLLDQPRPEVLRSAAWALRELAVPATFEDALAHAREATDRLLNLPKDRNMTPEEFSRVRYLPSQLTFLFELFGAVEYQPAEELLRKFIPKDGRPGHDARAAAIWALGKLHAGEEDAQLAEQFASRLSDLNMLDPENFEVRQMAAVSLGRMRAASQLKTLRQFEQLESGNFIGRSCAWSISQITGQPLRDAGTLEVPQTGWFLEPVKRRGE